MTTTLGGAGTLSAVIDPDRGAAVVAITLADGRELLSSVSAATRSRLLAEAPHDADPSQLSWMHGSHGGWELMAPNAGAAGSLGGTDFEFHGTAGRIPWSPTEHATTRVALASEIEGYRFGRSVEVGPTHVEVTETLEPDAMAPATWGSHLALGGALLDGPVELVLPGRVVGGSVQGLELDASDLAQWLRSPADGSAALVYLDCEGVGRASVLNRSQHLLATITWDAAVLPYLWVWVELSSNTGWPWFGTVRALGIEPVSAWPADGTADLAAAGHDVTLSAMLHTVSIRIEIDHTEEESP